MEMIVIVASGIFVLIVLTSLYLKRKSIKAFFDSIERRKEWARKRHLFLNNMNEGVNPFTGYQLVSYSINGKRNEKAIMAYNIPLEDLNCRNKWRTYLNNDLNKFIETLRSHEFKMLEISDCNGSKRIVRL